MSVGSQSGDPDGYPSSIRRPYSGVGANELVSPNPRIQLIPTTGTILVLNFAEVIQLTEDFYAPGSLGSFNLQLRVSAQNNSNYDWAASTAELIIMPMNCGVFVNEKGTGSIFTALLSKQDVLDVQGQQAYGQGEFTRMVGGGFLDNLKRSVGWITSKLPMVKNVLNHIPHAYAQTGAKVLDALGYAKPHGRLHDKFI